MSARVASVVAAAVARRGRGLLTPPPPPLRPPRGACGGAAWASPASTRAARHAHAQCGVLHCTLCRRTAVHTPACRTSRHRHGGAGAPPPAAWATRAAPAPAEDGRPSRWTIQGIFHAHADPLRGVPVRELPQRLYLADRDQATVEQGQCPPPPPPPPPPSPARAHTTNTPAASGPARRATPRNAACGRSTAAHARRFFCAC